MGPQSCTWSVVDRNVVMQRITVFNRSLVSLSQYTSAVFYDFLLVAFEFTPLLNLCLIIFR
jgi:hypothetical protein